MLCLGEQLTGRYHQRIGLGLPLLATALLDLGCTLGQSGKEAVDLFAGLGGGAKADVRGHLFACPVPDCFVRIEARAVRWQGHQAHIEPWRGEILSYRQPTVRRAIIPMSRVARRCTSDVRPMCTNMKGTLAAER